MGEEGFEPTQQQRHSVYSRARLSHSGAPPGGLEESRGGVLRDRSVRLHLEFRILRSSEHHARCAFDGVRGDAPPSPVADQYKEKVISIRVQPLHGSGPALVTAARRNLYAPSAISVIGRRLDLDTQQSPLQLDDKVDVRAMTEGDEHCCAEPREPFDRRCLSQIA